MSGALSAFNELPASYFAPVGLPTGGLVPVVAPPTLAASPLANPAERQATEALLGLITGDSAGGSVQGGFTGAGLRGSDVPNATVNNEDLGPHPGVMTNMQDALGVVGQIASVARGAMTGPIGMAMAMRNNPAVRGVARHAFGLADVAAERAAAIKAGQTAMRAGAPARGGPKNSNIASMFGDQSGDKPGGLSSAEAAAQAANAAATGDMGGAKGDPGGGNSDGGSHGGTSTGSSNYAGGGLIELAGGGKLSVGPGSGLDDLIPTSIDGRRAAALSDGEFVIPADVVSMFGDGSSSAGARRLYDLIKSVRQDKTGTSEQAGPLPVGQILKRALG